MTTRKRFHRHAFVGLAVLICLCAFQQKPVFVYAETTGVDVILLIDLSGSMRYTDRNRVVPASARRFVERLQSESGASRIGMIAFSGVMKQRTPLTPLDNPDNVSTLYTAIDKLAYSGYTDIGLAMREAVKMLQANDIGNRTVLLLLTDGMIEISPYMTYRTEAGSYKDVTDALDTLQETTPVYAVGLNDNGSVDAAFLEMIAQRTNARAYVTNEAEGLPGIFDEIFDSVIQLAQPETPDQADDEAPDAVNPVDETVETTPESNALDTIADNAELDVLGSDEFTTSENIDAVASKADDSKPQTDPETVDKQQDTQGSEKTAVINATIAPVDESEASVDTTAADTKTASEKAEVSQSPSSLQTVVWVVLIIVATLGACAGLYFMFLRKKLTEPPTAYTGWLEVRVMNSGGEYLESEKLNLQTYEAGMDLNAYLHKHAHHASESSVSMDKLFLTPASHDGEAALWLVNKGRCEISGTDDVILVHKKIMWKDSQRLTFTDADPEDLSKWEIIYKNQ